MFILNSVCWRRITRKVEFCNNMRPEVSYQYSTSTTHCEKAFMATGYLQEIPVFFEGTQGGAEGMGMDGPCQFSLAIAFEGLSTWLTDCAIFSLGLLVDGQSHVKNPVQKSPDPQNLLP